ncbi:MAG: PilZ domain-containing protein [Candidatus Hydrogenedentes bacterium]|nr:PilZ domain-containing protein [Candidatus Hydrogenedentota bacterium]
MKSRNENQRKFPRIELDVVTDVRIEETTTDMNVLTKNIGAGGVCLVLPDLLAVGTVVHLTIQLPDKLLAIEIPGEIIWSAQERHLLKKKNNAFVTGIKFTEIDPVERDRIIRITTDYLY